MATEVDGDHVGDPGMAHWQLLATLSSGVLIVLASFVMYVGIAVAVVVTGHALNLKAIAGGTAYGLAAVVAPTLVAMYLHRERQFSWMRAARAGAGICLLVNVLLVPVAIAAMAM